MGIYNYLVDTSAKETCLPTNRNLPSKQTTIHGMKLLLFCLVCFLVVVVDGMFEQKGSLNGYINTTEREKLK